MLPSGYMIGGAGAYPARISFGTWPTEMTNAGAICLSSDPATTGVDGWRCEGTGQIREVSDYA